MCQPAATNPLLEDRPFRRACAWENGEVRDVGDLGGPEAYAYDVNGRGWIVGSSDTSESLPSVPGFVHHAFLHNGRVMGDLGTLGGLASVAMALNERGEVVGWSLTGETTPNGVAVRHAFLWRAGVLHDIGTLGGPYSEAQDINNRGQIVGWSWLPTPNKNLLQRAVLWNQGTLLDLNDLVEDGGGWSLRGATAIDNSGRILANAYGDWQWRMVLLVPVRAR
jgi:probable HAF family extracellular repeat protein